jgi:hypothetical protein
MSWLRLILALLGTYRLTRLFVNEAGPDEIFCKLRAAVDCQAIRYGKGLWTFLDGLVNCEYCISVWAAALMAILVLTRGWLSDWALIWLGLSGAFCIAQEIKDKE